MSGGTTTASGGGAPEPGGASSAASAVITTFGPLKLSAGTTRGNITAYYWLALTSIMLFTFISALQASVLSTILGIPTDQQGRITSLLVFVAEVVLIVVVALSAAWSDRIGRRIVAVLGYLILAVGLVITPLVGNVVGLTAARAVAGVGVAMITGMITAIVTDYVRDETRGKANGLVGFCNGIGALITFFGLLQLPRLFENLGLGEVGALRATYVVVAIIAVTTALVLQAKLRPGRATESAEEPPIKQLLQEGLSAGKEPGLSLSYAAAFVARADLALVGTFLILWAQQYGENVLGLTAGEATAKAGLLVGIANGTALIVAPIIGIVSDRMGRTDAVLLALLLTAIGYTSTLLVDNPFSLLGYTVAAMIGFGQVSAVIASQVLVAEQAPPAIRGSVIGMFGLFGGIGIMIAVTGGGFLFDLIAPAAPFVLFGVAAAVVFIYGLTVRKRIIPNRYAEDEGTAPALI